MSSSSTLGRRFSLKKMFEKLNHRRESFDIVHVEDNEEIKNISGPTDFKHNMHIGFDNATGDFVGLPDSWKLWLKDSNIS